MSEAKTTLPRRNKEINPSVKDIERFWSKVDKRGEDECWEWKYGKSRSGYGNFWLNGLTVRANRAAWVIAKGPIDDGMCSCHKCDNPGCCNPNHLFLATSEENTFDRHLKGRTASGDKNGARTRKERMPRGDNHYARTNPEKLRRGEGHGMAKLTPENVKCIRLMDQSGETFTLIAKIFDISISTVSRIVKGDGWAHVK